MLKFECSRKFLLHEVKNLSVIDLTQRYEVPNCLHYFRTLFYFQLNFHNKIIWSCATCTIMFVQPFTWEVGPIILKSWNPPQHDCTSGISNFKIHFSTLMVYKQGRRKTLLFQIYSGCWLSVPHSFRHSIKIMEGKERVQVSLFMLLIMTMA